MNTDKQSFKDAIEAGQFMIFPGGTGTELQRRGYKTKLPLWSAQANEDAFDLVKEIHEDYFRAGADICVTNTFRTTPRTYRKIDRESDARKAMTEAVRAAKEAQKVVSNRPTYIAGSIAPLEDCYTPENVPSDDDLKREHTELANWLAEEDVDVLLIETINSLREARAMAEAASQTGLPFMASFVVDASGNLLDGTPLSNVLQATDLPGRIVVGLNCRAIDVIDSAFSALQSVYQGSTFLYPNGFGEPHDDLGWCFHDNKDTTDRFLEYARKWRDQGVQIIGGCCGTTPAYISALSEGLMDIKKAC